MESKKTKVQLDDVGVDALSSVLQYLDMKDRLAAREVSRSWREAHSLLPRPMSRFLSAGIQATPGQRVVAAAKAWAGKEDVTQEDVKKYVSGHEREVCSLLSGGYADCKDEYDISLPPSFPEQHRTLSINCKIHCSRTRKGKRLLNVFLKWFGLPPSKTLTISLGAPQLYPFDVSILHAPDGTWDVTMEVFPYIIEGKPRSAYKDTQGHLDRLFPDMLNPPWSARRKITGADGVLDIIARLIRAPMFNISKCTFTFYRGRELNLDEMEEHLGISSHI